MPRLVCSLSAAPVAKPTPAWFSFSAPDPIWGVGTEPGLASLPSSPQSLSSSPQAQPPRPAELSDEEVAELFQRLAETQQEKWMLEEKVLSACSSPLGLPLGRRPGWQEWGVGVGQYLARPLLMGEHAQLRA